MKGTLGRAAPCLNINKGPGVLVHYSWATMRGPRAPACPPPHHHLHHPECINHTIVWSLHTGFVLYLLLCLRRRLSVWSSINLHVGGFKCKHSLLFKFLCFFSPRPSATLTFSSLVALRWCCLVASLVSTHSNFISDKQLKVQLGLVVLIKHLSF